MKNRLVIEAGTELRIPTGKMQGWTLTALDGPAVTITVNSAPLSVGDTVGAGEVVITRAQDGSSNDTWVEFDDGEATAGPKGDTGATGPTGATGRGIASITVSNGHLTGTYSDGTPWDAGALPAGSGGGLDAEAVQDIIGQMLGETQGHYDDAAGTYTINLPTGGTVTDEQVQDIVGALIRAGSNVSVAYDDANNTLTVSAAGGAGGSPGSVYLSAPPSEVSPSAYAPTNFGAQVFGLFVPRSNFTLRGVRAAQQFSGLTASLEVWRPSDRSLLASSPTVGTDAQMTLTAVLDTPLLLAADTPYMIGLRASNSSIQSGQGSATYKGFGTINTVYYDSGYPASSLVNYHPGFTLLAPIGASKGVIGPLDPVDFPRLAVVDAPQQSGFMVVDDAAKTASLYWKFSDGSTKKVDLT